MLGFVYMAYFDFSPYLFFKATRRGIFWNDLSESILKPEQLILRIQWKLPFCAQVSWQMEEEF